MTAPTTPEVTHGDTAREASGLRDLRWLLSDLVEEAPGVRSVAVVSSDGVLLISSDPGDEQAGPAQAVSDQPQPEQTGSEHAGSEQTGSEHGVAQAEPARGPRGSSADLATIVSGLASLTAGAAVLMEGGEVRQTMVAMAEGLLFVMAISDGSLLGVHALPDCDMSVVAYQMARFVGRAGHVLTPELRSALRG